MIRYLHLDEVFEYLLFRLDQWLCFWQPSRLGHNWGEWRDNDDRTMTRHCRSCAKVKTLW